MRLYRARFSTNVERVALALAHKGLDVESVWIEYEDRSEVQRVSGQPLVPVLEDDGIVLADSMEIVRHLDERYPRAPLYPAGEARRAETALFIDWFNRVWKIAPNAIEAQLEGDGPRAGARVAELAAEMAGSLDRFESLLAGRDHLLGDEFAAADCAAFPFLKYAAGREAADDELFHRVLEEYQPLGDDHPRLAAWIERVDARPRV